MSASYGRLFLEIVPDFKVGDPMPDGYVARAEWAQVHLDAGLRQKRCSYCGLWKFPHQLSDKAETSKCLGISGRGRTRKVETVTLTHIKCLDCEKKV